MIICCSTWKEVVTLLFWPIVKHSIMDTSSFICFLSHFFTRLTFRQFLLPFRTQTSDYLVTKPKMKFFTLLSIRQLHHSFCYSKFIKKTTYWIFTQCLKITQNVSFEFLHFSLIFCPFKIDLSGTNVWPKKSRSLHSQYCKMRHLLCYFQTLWFMVINQKEVCK